MSINPARARPYAPRYWRVVDVDGGVYLWSAGLGRDRYHTGVRVVVRAAAPAAAQARTVLAGRGAALRVQTSLGGPQACAGPQCPRLAPPGEIGPRHVAEMIRQALALGWSAGASAASAPFDCGLAYEPFAREGAVQLRRSVRGAARGADPTSAQGP